MNSIKSVILLLIINSLTFFSCSKDDELNTQEDNLPPLVESLKLSQPEILSVDASGISLQFYFEGYGDSNIEEYGIVWYYDENNELLQNCVKPLYGKPQKREISLNIENGLPIDKIIYLRAYAKADNKIHYGQFVSVQSKGGRKPIINRILPENPKLSQQLKIEGEGFVQTLNSKYQSVFVNGFEIRPDSINENEIFFTLPSEYIESFKFNYAAKISIKVLGKEYTYDKEYNFISPWKRISLPNDFSSFAFKRGSATVLNNKAYILFGKQYKKMFVYDIPNNKWSTITYPGNPEQANFGPHINCYNFTANNKIYSIVDDTLYSKEESSLWLVETKYPGNPKANISPFVYFYNGYLYKGNFDVNYGGKGRSFYKYNLSKKEWVEITPIPNNGGSIYNYFVFIYEDNINIGTIRNNESYDFSKNIRIWSYSIERDNWSWKFSGDYADYPTTDDLNTVVSFTVNNQIFMGLGENHDDWPEYCSNKLCKFNPKTKYWDMVARCPNKINVSSTFVYNNKVYILGREQDEVFNDIDQKKFFYEFDPSLI